MKFKSGLQSFGKHLSEYRLVISYLSMVVIVFGMAQPIALYAANLTGYVVSRVDMFKNIFYLSLLAGLFLSYIFSRIKWLVDDFYINVIVVVSTLLLLGVLGFGAVKNFKYISMGAVFLYLYLFVYHGIGKESRPTYVKYFALSLCAVVLVLPILFGRHVNSESYVQKSLVKNKPDSAVQLSMVVSPKDIESVSNNYIAMVGSGFYSSPRGFWKESSQSSLKIMGNVGSDLSVACLFIDDYYLSPLECDQYLGIGSKLNIEEKKNYLKSLHYLDHEYKNQVLSAVEKCQVICGNFSNAALGKLMLVRGFVMHHYNSILQGFNGSAFDAFYNQYGFGPIALSKAISDIFGVTKFDSIYLSIFVLNAFVLVLLIALFGLNTILLFGYAASVFVVIEYSAILAPYLYFIRALPLIVIMFVLTRANKSSCKILLLPLFFIAGMYSKEYALFTILATFSTAIASRSKSYFIYGLSSVLGLIFIFLLANQQGILGANFLYLFFVGNGSSYSDMLFVNWVLWPSLLVALVSVLYINREHALKDTTSVFLSLLLILASLKYVTNASFNHLSFLFLILAGLIFHMSSNCYERMRELKAYCFSITCVVFIIGIPSLKQSFNLDQGVEYEVTHLSKIFVFDKGLVSNSEEIRGFVSKSDSCVISRHDDFISAYYEKNITGRFPNFSTNLNSIADFIEAVNVLNACRSVIVDRSLVDQSDKKHILSNWYNSNHGLNEYISGYILSGNGLEKFASHVVNVRSRTAETEHFYVYE